MFSPCIPPGERVGSGDKTSHFIPTSTTPCVDSLSEALHKQYRPFFHQNKYKHRCLHTCQGKFLRSCMVAFISKDLFYLTNRSVHSTYKKHNWNTYTSRAIPLHVSTLNLVVLKCLNIHNRHFLRQKYNYVLLFTSLSWGAFSKVIFIFKHFNSCRFLTNRSIH